MLCTSKLHNHRIRSPSLRSLPPISSQIRSHPMWLMRADAPERDLPGCLYCRVVLNHQQLHHTVAKATTMVTRPTTMLTRPTTMVTRPTTMVTQDTVGDDIDISQYPLSSVASWEPHCSHLYLLNSNMGGFQAHRHGNSLMKGVDFSWADQRVSKLTPKGEGQSSFHCSSHVGRWGGEECKVFKARNGWKQKFGNTEWCSNLLRPSPKAVIRRRLSRQCTINAAVGEEARSLWYRPWILLLHVQGAMSGWYVAAHHKAGRYNIMPELQTHRPGPSAALSVYTGLHVGLDHGRPITTMAGSHGGTT